MAQIDFLYDGFTHNFLEALDKGDYEAVSKMLSMLSEKAFKSMVDESRKMLPTPLLCLPLLSPYNKEESKKSMPQYKFLPIQLKITKQMLSLGANPNEFFVLGIPGKTLNAGMNPMMTAGILNCTEALQLYKEAGAEFRFSAPELGTFLYNLAPHKFYKHLPTLQFLIDEKVDINESFEGWNPLTQAATEHSVKPFQMLMNAGADPNASDNEYSIAHFIMRNGWWSDEQVIEAFDLLKAKGVDFSSRDSEGNTLLDTAKEMAVYFDKRKKVISYLKKMNKEKSPIIRNQGREI